MSVKLLYSIATIDKYNFWAIPKCGNTSIKHDLLDVYGLAVTNDPDDSTYRWVHKESLMRYITPNEANNNGNYNFTFVRDPVERFISLYKDFCIRRKDIPEIWQKTPEQLFEIISNQPQERLLNIHMRSLSYFLNEFKGDIFLINDYKNKLNSIEKDTTIAEELKNKVKDYWSADYRYIDQVQPIENFYNAIKQTT